jgi:hypothetical protein
MGGKAVKKAAEGGAEVTDTGEGDDPTSGGLEGILVRARFRTEKKRLVRSQRIGERYTVKKVSGFPVPSRDVTKQNPQFNYSCPGRVWLMTSRLGTGKPLTFFTVQWCS